MRNPKYHLYLTQDERRMIVKSLIELRNYLISESRYTDVIDELLVKFTNAKIKRVKGTLQRLKGMRCKPLKIIQRENWYL